MTDEKLKATLQPIIQEHGLGAVLKSLGEIEDAHDESVKHPARPLEGAKGGTKQRRPKVTAPEYVRKMELPSEKFVAVSELAERFQQKSFLPSFGDVANFCQVHDIEVPASKSRLNAIPRIFSFIAEMDIEEVQRILDYELFSGPSRLGPISDAIRNYGRA